MKTPPPFIDRWGIEFSHGVDRVLWLWPWRRQGGPAFISIYLSGTGEFGDARFASLRELRDAWVELDARLSR